MEEQMEVLVKLQEQLDQVRVERDSVKREQENLNTELKQLQQAYQVEVKKREQEVCSYTYVTKRHVNVATVARVLQQVADEQPWSCSKVLNHCDCSCVKALILLIYTA